jgi:transcriptional regulator with XRE-family HTH domain
MSQLAKLIGSRIREIRKQKGMTQEELGEKASIHYSNIGGAERGVRNISLETLEKIIFALGMTPADFFRFQEEDMKNFGDPEKQLIVETIKNQLVEYEVGDIKRIHKILREIFAMIEERK